MLQSYCSAGTHWDECNQLDGLGRHFVCSKSAVGKWGWGRQDLIQNKFFPATNQVTSEEISRRQTPEMRKKLLSLVQVSSRSRIGRYPSPSPPGP